MRKILQAVMTALCLAAALSGYWIWSAQQLRDGLADWRRQTEAEGRKVTFADPEITGFPLALALTLQAPALETPGKWLWAGPRIQARSWIFKPQEVSVDAAGRHRLTFAQGQGLGQAMVALDRADAALRLDGKGRLTAAELTLGGASGVVNGELHFDLAALSAAVAQGTADEGLPPPRLDLGLAAHGLSLESALLRPFGNTIETLELDGRLYGWRADRWDRAALSRWRDGGGRLAVDRLRLIWDDVTVMASGRLALDEKLRPLGELDAWWRGLADAVDRLTAAKRVKAEAAMVLKLGLLALPTRTAADGDTEVNLPLSFDRGQLFLGPLPLAKLRPLAVP